MSKKPAFKPLAFASFACLLLLHTSCHSFRQEVGLPKFLVDAAPKNRFIVNRKPHYGYGRPDRCVEERPIKLSLSTAAGQRIEGEVKDVKTLEVLPGALVQIIFLGQPAPVTTSADSLGRIQLTQLGDIQKIDVNYIGYRTLHIDMSQK